MSLILNQAYDRATDELPPGVDPSEYVIILPDWGGRVSRAYGVGNTGRAAAIVVVDEDSNVADSYQGGTPRRGCDRGAG